LAAGILLTACQSGSFSKHGAANPATVSGGGPSPIPAMARTRFSDVPLPQGIKEDIERSYVYESASLQVGRMVYNVGKSVTNVAQFYINEAPRHGWQLTSMLQAEGAQITFEKPAKRMWVSVSPDGLRDKNSRLVIHVVPEETTRQTRLESAGPAR
jgi:hypothetical protein